MFAYGVVTGGRRKVRYGLLSVAAVMAAAQFANAAAFTIWGGPGSTTTTTTWGTATNWGSGLPSITQVAQFSTTFSNQPNLGAAATAEGIWATTGLGQDVTISSSTLTITGDASYGITSHATAGIVLDDTANHNLTISSAVTLSNSQSFWVDNAGTLTLGAVNLGSKTLTLSGGNSSGNIVLGGVVSTAGSIVVNTAGTVTITGATNTFTGGVTLTAGALNLNNVRALGAAAAGPLVINGGTIDTTNGTGTLTSLASSTTIGGNFTYGGTGNLNLGVSPIVNAGDRTITLNGTGKTLTMGGLMTNTKGSAQTTTVNGAGNTFSIGSYALSSSSGDLIDVINGTGNVTIGVVSNGTGSTASGLTYSGSGTLNLGAANTFGGLLTVSSGTVTVSGASTGAGGVTLTSGTLNINAVGAAGNGPLGNGGTLTINGGTIDNTSAAAKVVVNNNPITIGGSFAFSTSAGTANNNLTLPGAVSLAADQTITLNGAGALTLSGLLTNSSDSVRTLTVNNGSGTAATTLLTIGSFNLTSAATPRVDVINGTGNVTITGVVGNGTGAGSGLAYGGTGMLTLSGANSFSGGLFVKQGTVLLNNTTAGGGAGGITLGDASGGNANLLGNTFTMAPAITLGTGAAGTLTIGNNGGATAPVFTGTVNLNSNNLTLSATGTGSATFSGAISGSGNLTITGGGSSVTLSNTTNSFAGTVTINTGNTLIFSGSGALGNSSTIFVQGTLQSSAGSNLSQAIKLGSTAGTFGSFYGKNNLTLSGVVSDNSSDNALRAISGQDATILTNTNNSYTGGTQIFATTAGANGFTTVKFDSDNTGIGQNAELGKTPDPGSADGAGNHLVGNIQLRGLGAELLLVNPTTSNSWSATLNINRGITLGSGGNGNNAAGSSIGGSIVPGNGNTLVYGGVISDEISGAHGVLQVGGTAGGTGGLLVLGGTSSSYSGGTQVIQAEVLLAASDGATTGPLGAVPSSAVTNIALGGGIGGVVGGGGTVSGGKLGVLSGAGNITLSGNRGITIVSGTTGTLEALTSTDSLTYNGAITSTDSTSNLTLNAGGGSTLNLGGSSAVTGNITLSGSGTINLTGNNPGTTGKVISSGGSTMNINLSGTNNGFASTSVFTVVGANSTAANAALLTIAGDGSLGTAPSSASVNIVLGGSGNSDRWGGLINNFSGTLNANRSISIGGSAFNTANSGGVITVTSGNTVTYGGSIQAVNVQNPNTTLQLFRASDNGTLILTGARPYTGNTTVVGGNVSITNASALGFGGIVSNSVVGGTTVSGGVLDISGQTFTGPITLSGGMLTNSSASLTTLTGGVTGVAINGAGNNFTASPLFTAVPTVSFSSGTAAANALLGVSAGTWSSFVNSGSYGTVAPTVTIGAPAPGGVQATATANLTAGAVTSLTITNPGSGYTSQPTISFTGGTGSVTGETFNGLALTGLQQTSPGGTYATVPTVSLSAPAVAGTTTYTAVLSNVTLSGTASTIGGDNGNIQIDGVISGASGGFSKTGTNTLIFTNVNTYGGATNVKGGTLALNGSGGNPAILGGTAITVGNGSAFGNGTLQINNNLKIGTATAGSITVLGGDGSTTSQGTLSLVDGGINTLTLSNNTAAATVLTMGGAGIGSPSILNLEINGSGIDAIIATKGIVINPGGVTLNVTTLATPANGTYNFITTTGAITGTGIFLFSNNSTIETVGTKTYTLGANSTTEFLTVADAAGATSTTFTLGSGATSMNVLKGGKTAVTSTITNTGTGTADTLDFTGLGLGVNANGTITGTTSSGGPLANGGGNSTNSGQAFQGTSYGNSILTPAVSTATNHTISGSASNGGTTPITINVGQASADRSNNRLTFGVALTAAVGSGDAYDGLSSKVVGDTGGSGAAFLGSEAIILKGTASSATTVSMAWRTRNTDEEFPSNASPPFGGPDSGLMSDVVNISGTGTDLYALQISYDPTQGFPNTIPNMGFFNGTNWVNAGTAPTEIMTAFNPATDFVLGNWGVDMTNDVAWVVVNHGGAFAVVPEPASLALMGLGAVGLISRRRRR